jgi:hypothetical protein
MFEEEGRPRILLLRTALAHERDAWVRYVSQYVHVGTLSGVPVAHPLDSSGHKGFDPEELDARERIALRRQVLEWDEGQMWRQQNAVMDPVAMDWASDSEHHNSASPSGGSAQPTPRGPDSDEML